MSDRVLISRAVVGITSMQVCCVNDVTDEEILEVCNRENASGTSKGWTTVIRKEGQQNSPITCESYRNRTHFIVQC